MRARILASLCLNAVALYTPFLWVFLIDYPWNSYRWHWVSMYPVLPGLVPVEVPRALLGLPRWSDTWMIIASGGATALLLAATTVVGSTGRDAARTRRARRITAAALLLVSCILSLATYSAFRA